MTTRCQDCGRPAGGADTCGPCRIDIIEENLSLGIDIDTIVADFDISRRSLERQMHRYGRNDLARLVHEPHPGAHESDLRRRHPCADCGTLVGHNSTRCKPCSARWLNSTTTRRRAA